MRTLKTILAGLVVAVMAYFCPEFVGMLVATDDDE